MAEYLRPDVYVEELASGEKPIQSVSTSVGAMVGITPRGVIGEPILVTNWTEFTRKFANGLDTPFMKSSDLPNAVYGFFQNGGSKCYIVRVPSTTMAKAKAVNEEETCTLVALDEGEWANKLVVTVKAQEEVEGMFNILVKLNGNIVEEFEGVSNNEDATHYDYLINGQSAFFTIEEGSILEQGEFTFEGGQYSISNVADKEYLGPQGLKALDTVKVNIVAIPGKTSDAIHNDLLSYAEGRQDCFAVLDCPKGMKEVTDVTKFRSKLSGCGATYYPWGKILDPLSPNGSLKLCPPSGHIMGVYARTDVERGVHKAPAGEEAKVRGFVELEKALTPGEIDILNPLGVNCIVAKPNKGIVVWGARSLMADPSKRYISDVRYDIMVKNSLYDGCQWAVFEPNDHDLWSRVSTSLASYLDLQWRNGALFGETAEQAYYVKCDEELNTEASRNAGMLVAEIGYAKKKPAEFVIVRIVQKSQAN